VGHECHLVGLWAILGGIALVGKLQGLGLAAVYLVLIKSGLLETARDGDAAVGDV